MQHPMSPFVKDKLDEYAKTGCAVGGFLSAVLANDLKEALAQADSDNLESLQSIVQYIYCHLPSTCWGSYEKVRKWAQHRGSEYQEQNYDDTD